MSKWEFMVKNFSFINQRLQHTYKRRNTFFILLAEMFKLTLPTQLCVLFSSPPPSSFPLQNILERGRRSWGSSFLVFTSMDIKEYTLDELTLSLLHVTTANPRSNANGTSHSPILFVLTASRCGSVLNYLGPKTHLTSLWKASPTTALKSIWSITRNDYHSIPFHKCT